MSAHVAMYGKAGGTAGKGQVFYAETPVSNPRKACYNLLEQSHRNRTCGPDFCLKFFKSFRTNTYIKEEERVRIKIVDLS